MKKPLGQGLHMPPSLWPAEFSKPQNAPCTLAFGFIAMGSHATTVLQDAAVGPAVGALVGALVGVVGRWVGAWVGPAAEGAFVGACVGGTESSEPHESELKAASKPGHEECVQPPSRHATV